MFGWSKWEKFRDRFRAAMAGNLTEQEMELALAWIKKGSIRSKEEFIKDIEWTMRNNWGSYTSKRFQENGLRCDCRRCKRL